MKMLKGFFILVLLIHMSTWIKNKWILQIKKKLIDEIWSNLLLDFQRKQWCVHIKIYNLQWYTYAHIYMYTWSRISCEECFKIDESKTPNIFIDFWLFPGWQKNGTMVKSFGLWIVITFEKWKMCISFEVFFSPLIQWTQRPLLVFLFLANVPRLWITDAVSLWEMMKETLPLVRYQPLFEI
jgi:hypothetical protein